MASPLSACAISAATFSSVSPNRAISLSPCSRCNNGYLENEFASARAIRKNVSPRGPHSAKSKVNMLYTIAVILGILWLLGFSFHIAGAFIHLLLVLAVIALVFKLVTGRTP